MDQVFGSLQPMWETRREDLAPASRLTWLLLVWTFREGISGGRISFFWSFLLDVALSLCFYISKLFLFCFVFLNKVKVLLLQKEHRRKENFQCRCSGVVFVFSVVLCGAQVSVLLALSLDTEPKGEA